MKRQALLVFFTHQGNYKTYGKRQQQNWWDVNVPSAAVSAQPVSRVLFSAALGKREAEPWSCLSPLFQLIFLPAVGL